VPFDADGRAATAGWWRRAVVYQVYIRSFADADGDGVGDVAGIRSRLPYLRDLGVDAIWITPWYPSPMADGGYDVADYRDIDPRLGTLDEARALIADAHTAGLRVIIDLVPNHTSSAHPWFREALGASRDSAARARYLFRDGRGPGGDEPPNNWQSVFGGIAWTPAPDDGIAPRQWYLHLFDASQPDLDWLNPEVRTEFESILGFWLGVGVDGFRIDVAFFLLKASGLPDIPTPTPAVGAGEAAGATRSADAHPLDGHPYQDQEDVHDIYRSWRRLVDDQGEAVFCGEIDLPADRIARYLRPDELHTAFNFDFLRRPWDADALRTSIDATLASHSAVGAPATWVLGNHDAPRPVYRYGRTQVDGMWDAWSREAGSDQAIGLVRARAAALLYLALPGSAYLYQGEELGLPEVLDLPDELLQDPTFLRTGGRVRGRDGCRVPIPWSGDGPPFGFGPEGSEPWLPQPAAWRGYTVAAESADPGSMLTLYREALRIRRREADLGDARFEWSASPDGTLVFRRGDGFACAVNLSGEPLVLPAARTTLLRSDGAAGDALAPDVAEWYRLPAGQPGGRSE
jgi:alpha-glucosidase